MQTDEGNYSFIIATATKKGPVLQSEVSPPGLKMQPRSIR